MLRKTSESILFKSTEPPFFSLIPKKTGLLHWWIPSVHVPVHQDAPQGIFTFIHCLQSFWICYYTNTYSTIWVKMKLRKILTKLKSTEVMNHLSQLYIVHFLQILPGVSLLVWINICLLNVWIVSLVLYMFVDQLLHAARNQLERYRDRKRKTTEKATLWLHTTKAETVGSKPWPWDFDAECNLANNFCDVFPPAPILLAFVVIYKTISRNFRG